MKNKQRWKINDHKFLLQTLNNKFFKKCYLISIYSDTVDYKDVCYLHTPTRVVSRNMLGKNNYRVLGLSVFVLDVFFKSRLLKISEHSFLHTYKKVEPIAFRLQNLLSKNSIIRTNVFSKIQKAENKYTAHFSGVVGVLPRKFIANAVRRINNNLFRTCLPASNFNQIIETNNKLKKQMFNRIIIKNKFSLEKMKIFKKTKSRKPNRLFKFLFAPKLTKLNSRLKN